MIAALQDDDWQVRDAAAKTLRTAGVAPELYVPQILNQLASGHEDGDRYHAAERLVAVAPAAAAFAPQMIEIFREERAPYVKKQLRIALDITGTPEAKGAAAIDKVKESMLDWAPYVVFVVFDAVVSVLLWRSGWGVALALFLPASSLVWFLNDRESAMVAGLGFAPILSLAGLIAGWRVKSDSQQKDWLRSAGLLVSVIGLLGSILVLFGLFRFFSVMERANVRHAVEGITVHLRDVKDPRGRLRRM